MKKLFLAFICLCAAVCAAQTNIRANNGSFSGSVTTKKINGIRVVDGVNFLTVQAAITDACLAGGGTVYVPAGTYPQNSHFTLCSNLNLIGAGKGTADTGTCVTTITTTMTSGDLLPVANMTDIKISDMCIKAIGGSGGNAFLRLNYGQRVIAENLFIYGPFLRGIELDSSSTSMGSTIWNFFRNIHINGLASGGIGCLLDSSDATDKVINNNYFFNVSCTGSTTGSSAAGMKLTNTNHAQVINELFVSSGELEATAGTALLITQGATRGMACYQCNIEGSNVGFSKDLANTVMFVMGNISSNSTNISDAQPAFTGLLMTNVGGVVQQFAVDPNGGVDTYGIGLNSSAVQNAINGPTGWTLRVASSVIATINSNSFSLFQPLINANLLSATNGNSVTLLNVQSNLAAVAGTGSDAPVFSYAIPPNIVATAKAIRIRFYFSHSTGSAGVNYKFKAGSTVISNYGSPSGVGTYMGGMTLYNQGSGLFTKIDDPLVSPNPSLQSAPGFGAGNSGDFSAGFTISLTMNVAITDQVTPQFWTVEAIF